MKNCLVLILLLLLITYLYPQSLWNDEGHIPQNYQLDWNLARLQSAHPQQALNIFDVTLYGATPDNNIDDDFGGIALAIQTAQSTPGLSIIYFPEGEYLIKQSIHLENIYSSGTIVWNGNLVFQGEGADKTILKFQTGNSSEDCFYLNGYETSNEVELTEDILKGTNSIESDTDGFSTINDNSWIRLSEYDYPIHSSWAKGSVGQITTLLRDPADNTKATMYHNASKEYLESRALKIWEIHPIQNVGFENIKIYRLDGNSNSDNHGHNIKFGYSTNCWVKGVESYYTSKHHINVWFSSNIEISGCYFHKARSYAGDGYGYGVILEYSTNYCLVENNIFETLRHAMLVQVGANSNVFTYNYSRDQEWTNGFWKDLLGGSGPDICLHGNYPFGNLFEHNWAERIIADDTHGNNGPYNAFVRNYSKDSDGVFHHMILYNAPYSSVLGCELRCDELYQPIMQSGTTNLVTDLWGKVATTDPDHNTYETAFWHTHESLAKNLGIWDYGVLFDNSYYHSSIPPFVVEHNISFPSIGPPIHYVSQNIPAKNRYSNTIKTYLPFDKQTHAPVYILQGSDINGLYSSLNSALADVISGQTIVVYMSQNLLNNTVIPSGVTLKIESGTDISLNGYQLNCSGSGIIVNEGNVSGCTSYFLYGSNYKGFFPSSVTIAQLVNLSAPGWSIYLNSGTYSQTASVDIPSDRTLNVNPNVAINFSNSYKLNIYGTLNCLGTSGQPVTINGQNYSRSGFSNAMVDIKSGGTANIQYTNFINSPYHVITRNNANTQISHCNFSGFGFDSNSRAITVYQCSTGTVNINHCTFTGSGQNGIGIQANDTFGNSNVIFTNNAFSSCRYGIRCYSSYAHLTGNTIQNSYYYGIYADNVSNAAKYTGNTVSGNSLSYGVYLTSSSPYLISNEITSNKVFINSGAPNFADPTDPNWRGYNTVANASAALIRVQNYASPYLGYGMASGYNSIYYTDYPHIYATDNSGVYADHNYWGPEGPVNFTDGTSWVLDRWPLDYNPNLGKAAQGEPSVSSTSPDEKEDEAEFMAAIEIGFGGDYVKAKEQLNALIAKETTLKYPVLSLLAYDYFTKREADDPQSNRSKSTVESELTVLLNDLSAKEMGDPLRPFGLKLSARQAALNGEYAEFSAYNNQLIKEYPQSIHELTSLFDEISY
jgi:hypothetical protein